MSIDPMTFMDTGNPSYFNRYRYCSNDPVNCFDPNGETDIYIGGAMDKRNDGRGPVQSYANRQQSKAGRTVEYFTAGDKKGALAFAKANASNGEPLNIIGHSFGTVTAANVADSLGEAGIQVDTLVGVDSVNKPFKKGGLGDAVVGNVVGVNSTGSGGVDNVVETIGKIGGLGKASAFKSKNLDVSITSDTSHGEFEPAFTTPGADGRSAMDIVDDTYKQP